LRGVLQPHRNVKPVGDRRHREPGFHQNGLQSWATVSEGDHCSLGRLADGSQTTSDQGRYIGVDPGDRGKNLPASLDSLDVAHAVIGPAILPESGL
jgi:hypothetical protein